MHDVCAILGSCERMEKWFVLVFGVCGLCLGFVVCACVCGVWFVFCGLCSCLVFCVGV